MRKSERVQIILEAATISDNNLEHYYYSTVFKSLDSQVEEMYERGYSIEDIRERERYEKYLSEKCDILEDICKKRGIKLWSESIREEM